MHTLPDANRAIADANAASGQPRRRSGHIAPGLGLGGLILAIIVLAILL